MKWPNKLLLLWAVTTLITAAVIASDAVTSDTALLHNDVNHQAEDSMEEVIVTGEWAGPQMWKISRGTHVVWMLGTLQPLPKDMVWKYQEVEKVIAQSRQVIGRTNVKPKVSIFGIIPLYLQFRKVSKLPDDQTLKDVLPAELYQRYQSLLTMNKVRDNDIEKLRPIVAAGRLYQEIIEANGLTGKNDVQGTVFKIADRHDVKVNDLTLKVEAPKEILKEASQLPVSAEIPCLEDVVASLEEDLPMLKRRASSWARGDVNALRKLISEKTRTACREIILSMERVKAVSDNAKAVWFNAITESLDRYDSAMALSPVYDLIGKDGILDQLRAAGYQVGGP